MSNNHPVVKLPNSFQRKHWHVLEQYLANQRLSSSQWWTLLEGFDFLKNATVQRGSERYTFRAFYRLRVDKVYANAFLKKLSISDKPEQDGLALHASYERQLITQLIQSGWIDVRNYPSTLYLRAYCVYWWQSFTKGYLFEATVYHHLRQSGLRFWAHDFTKPTERYNSYDLSVSGWQGDVRTSTYFLNVARTRALSHAFYITRLWHRQRRKQVWAVVMQPDVWATIDGDTEVVKLSDAPLYFPSVSEFYWRNRSLIVADYTVWLIKILHYQEKHDE